MRSTDGIVFNPAKIVGVFKDQDDSMRVFSNFDCGKLQQINLEMLSKGIVEIP